LGELRNSYKILTGKPEGRRHLMRLILKKLGVRMWNGFSCLRTGYCYRHLWT